jgi:mono/diheme cytochrome c family protein
MPPFRDSLDDGQIASLANFVRTEFGGVQSNLSERDVAEILKGGADTP